MEFLEPFLKGMSQGDVAWGRNLIGLVIGVLLVLGCLWLLGKLAIAIEKLIKAAIPFIMAIGVLVLIIYGMFTGDGVTGITGTASGDSLSLQIIIPDTSRETNPGKQPRSKKTEKIFGYENPIPRIDLGQSKTKGSLAKEII